MYHTITYLSITYLVIMRILPKAPLYIYMIISKYPDFFSPPQNSEFRYELKYHDFLTDINLEPNKSFRGLDSNKSNLMFTIRDFLHQIMFL